MTYVEFHEKHYRRAKIYIAFVTGMLVGLWTFPESAMSIPKTTNNVIAYYPLNQIYLIIILFVPLGYVFYYYMERNRIDNDYSEDYDNGPF